MESRLTPALAAIGAAVAEVPFIDAAWVFGSVARGDAGAQSDLDLAVLLRPDASPDTEASLRALAQALEAHAPAGRVDIVVLGRQGPVFRHRVLAEGVLVHDADPGARVAYEGRTIAEYLDWLPTHEIAMRSSLAGIRRRLAGAGA